ncbi:DUF58 domain-containing protein [Aphanothece sacrum]|uniref:DUF58 domain-containing protein n=1 Tax=Aphanothece sacrum FPU1 TaxID=1920663 RepID=A0A401ICI7_APHSA|nr:DUF58 domain-containing protein [Aphanothece sacrum]GBF78962.1 hypothetical protein AsFPU1_0354 [Aphanothece sacrum FPU1]GBF86690.1 hypothetical protein AsFPU3_3762 [Aphanothece sacrum FPU3]
MIPSIKLYIYLLFGIVIALFLAIIFNSQFTLPLILIFDSIILILAILDSQQVKSYCVQITRKPLHRLSIGRDNLVELVIKNHNQNAQIIIKDDYPLDFLVSQTTLKIILQPHITQEVTYTIKPNQRGEYTWGNIQVKQLGKWKLAWYSWTIKAEQKVFIYPDLIGLRSLSIRLTLENTGSMRQGRRFGIGTEFSELQEYNKGDDIRLIDWKATARRNRPFIRVLEPEKEQTLIILLDRGRLMTSQVQGLKRFDWGLNATLSLALAGLHRGDKVGIGVFDKQVLTWIPPQRGQHQLSIFLERLSPIQPVLLEPDYVGTVSQLVQQQSRRALVVLITDIIDTTASAELLSAMGKLTPRYLPFCIALRDPQVDSIAHTSTIKVDEAYQRAVALDLLSQRQVAFAKLKQQGVLVLDAPANQISDQLVNRYLQLKAKSLL